MKKQYAIFYGGDSNSKSGFNLSGYNLVMVSSPEFESPEQAYAYIEEHLDQGKEYVIIEIHKTARKVG
jgi:hypothetical protein